MVNKVKRCWGKNHLLCRLSLSLGWLVGCYIGKAVFQGEGKLLFLCVRPLAWKTEFPLWICPSERASPSASVHNPSPCLSFVQCCFICLFILLLVRSLLLLPLLELEGVPWHSSFVHPVPKGGSSSQPHGEEIRWDIFLQIVFNKNTPKLVFWVFGFLEREDLKSHIWTDLIGRKYLEWQRGILRLIIIRSWV